MFRMIPFGIQEQDIQPIDVAESTQTNNTVTVALNLYFKLTWLIIYQFDLRGLRLYQHAHTVSVIFKDAEKTRY